MAWGRDLFAGQRWAGRQIPVCEGRRGVADDALLHCAPAHPGTVFRRKAADATLWLAPGSQLDQA